MTLRLQRLNHDATWWVALHGTRVMFDPWLVGTEVDIGRWFNEAWHVDPVCGMDALPPADIVVISQHFSDHFHPETLAAMPGVAHVVSVPQAYARVRRLLPNATHHVLPEASAPLSLLGVELWRHSRPWWHPPRYHAVVVQAQGRSVVHAPHGLPVAVAQEVASRTDVAVLAVSRVGFRLPRVLGGAVNPGPEAADAAALACGADAVLAIHDEAKASRGLVSRLATVDRRAARDGRVPWLEVGDLEVVTV